MKTILSFIMLLLTAVGAVAEPEKSPLLGHWQCNNGGAICDYTFLEDGTFTGSLTISGKVVWIYAGKWSLTDGKLSYEFTKSSVERLPPGTKDMDEVTEIKKDYYVIKAQDGSQRKYVRVE